jgi:hypothetical protein
LKAANATEIKNTKIEESLVKIISEYTISNETIAKIVNVTGEEAAYANMIASYNKGVVPVVSDSYDLYKAVYAFWGESLKPLVIAKHKNDNGASPVKKIVIRPDSGDPLITCCRLFVLLGLQFQELITEEYEHKLLNGIGVIQGDGVNEESVTNILNALTKVDMSNIVDSDGNTYESFEDIVKLENNTKRDTKDAEYKAVRKSPVLFGIFGDETSDETLVEYTKDDGKWTVFEVKLYNKCKDIRDEKKKLYEVYKYKWHPDCIVFGMGGALLQRIHRDTQKWAMKCSSIIVDNAGKTSELSVTKDPITDQDKKSKTGMVKLYSKKDNNKTKYEFFASNAVKPEFTPEFKVRYYGNLKKEEDQTEDEKKIKVEKYVTFQQIRDKSKEYNNQNKTDLNSFKKTKRPAAVEVVPVVPVVAQEGDKGGGGNFRKSKYRNRNGGKRRTRKYNKK